MHADIAAIAAAAAAAAAASKENQKGISSVHCIREGDDTRRSLQAIFQVSRHDVGNPSIIELPSKFTHRSVGGGIILTIVAPARVLPHCAMKFGNLVSRFAARSMRSSICNCDSSSGSPSLSMRLPARSIRCSLESCPSSLGTAVNKLRESSSCRRKGIVRVISADKLRRPQSL